MSLLAKRIIVFGMLWVLLVMVLTQVYDNVTGRGMPPRAAATPTAEAAAQPDDTTTQIANLQSCVASDPKNLKCVTDLADLYYGLKQYPQAQVNYQQAVGLDPHNVALLLRLGVPISTSKSSAKRQLPCVRQTLCSPAARRYTSCWAWR